MLGPASPTTLEREEAVRSAYPIWALAMLFQPIAGGYLLASPGATACSELAEYTDYNPELTDAAMVLWAEGFMRNMNEEPRPEVRRDLMINSKEQADKLRAYCDAHPFASFDQAVIYFSLQP
jgi:hypothetical protein